VEVVGVAREKWCPKVKVVRIVVLALDDDIPINEMSDLYQSIGMAYGRT
jgi:hypothetical protein